MNFKVGDKVRRVSSTDFSQNGMQIGDLDVVVSARKGSLTLEKFGKGHWDVMFELVKTPDLETELRLCESRRGILSKRIGEDQEEKKSLEKRIQELQQAIKERDKPKGMIKVGDKIPLQSFLVCASGDVRPHLKNSWSSANVAMGNLFYDKESAERAVHDRKQRVLRGEGV